jgi:predicted Holliday junction resolvase-like endonuclease
MIWTVLALSLGASLCFTILLYIRSESEKKLLNKRFIELIKSNQKIANTLASIRVKHGQTWETFLPLMETFERTIGPKENAVFLGQPLDLIYFNDDEVIFVEVKTGNSRLSSKQRHIRNLIKDRKVRWEEVNDALEHALPGIDRISSARMMKTIPHRKPLNES